MKLVFMGTPEFARAILVELTTSRHELLTVVTGEDKPVGRRRKLTPTEVRLEAERAGLPVITAGSLKERKLREKLDGLRADLFVVAAFRILPASLFKLPRLGSINVHASLLPRYRGAAPINWALINGESETGLTSFFLKEKVDTGDVILRERVAIAPTDTYDSLHAVLCRKAGPFTLRTLDLIERGEAAPLPQDEGVSSPAPKLRPEDGLIDFGRPAERVKDFVRGLSSKPGAFCFFRGSKLKVHRAAVADPGRTESAPAGTVLPDKKRLLVGCAPGVVELLRVVPAGKKEMDGAAFITGFRPRAGESLAKVLTGVKEEL
jgi:methionyl-tRNA formyltransferase